MSKEEQEAERIYNFFYDRFKGRSGSFGKTRKSSIFHVEGIVKEYDISRMVNVDRLKFYKEVLTILKNK